MKRISFCLAVLGLFSACTLADVQVNVVSERTALENQVLGSYNALDREMLTVASVRGVDPNGEILSPPPRSGAEADALQAMQVIRFHADDVEAFKRLGWVGENNQGRLTPFEMERDAVPADLADFAERYGAEELAAVVEAVNAARETVMQRVVAVNEAFTADDLPEIRRVFARLNLENAAAGERIQEPDGTWRTKP